MASGTRPQYPKFGPICGHGERSVLRSTKTGTDEYYCCPLGPRNDPKGQGCGFWLRAVHFQKAKDTHIDERITKAYNEARTNLRRAGKGDAGAAAKEGAPGEAQRDPNQLTAEEIERNQKRLAMRQTERAGKDQQKVADVLDGIITAIENASIK